MEVCGVPLLASGAPCVTCEKEAWHPGVHEADVPQRLHRRVQWMWLGIDGKQVLVRRIDSWTREILSERTLKRRQIE